MRCFRCRVSLSILDISWSLPIDAVGMIEISGELFIRGDGHHRYHVIDNDVALSSLLTRRQDNRLMLGHRAVRLSALIGPLISEAAEMKAKSAIRMSVIYFRMIES